MTPGLPGFREFLVGLAEPPAQPDQGLLSRQHRLNQARVRSTTHRRVNTPKRWLSRFRRTTPRRQPPKPTPPADQLGSSPVLDIGGTNHHRQKQPGGIHHNVALAPRYLPAHAAAPRPPFPVVFTNRLSMMAALGAASLSSIIRLDPQKLRPNLTDRNLLKEKGCRVAFAPPRDDADLELLFHLYREKPLAGSGARLLTETVQNDQLPDVPN